MKYLICYVWSTTDGNHAGMSHMCDLLVSLYPQEYKVLKIKPYKKKDIFSINFLNRSIGYINRHFFNFKSQHLFRRFISKAKKNDTIYLLEYMHKMCNQNELAIAIRAHNPNLKIVGLAHLTPQDLSLTFSSEELLSWSAYVDKIMTLGSSLTSYFVENGIDENKVTTSFHYVDSRYYRNESIVERERAKVIIIGNMKRNFSLLKQIIVSTPNISYTLCAGKTDMSTFEGIPNLTILGFLEEDELRSEMSEADISLNVMDDTVGSNVITTSMSMGLAMVVSDVGSIRDYCEDSNSLFCNTLEEYMDALNRLNSDSNLLHSMKLSSIKLSKRFEINMFNNYLNNISLQ